MADCYLGEIRMFGGAMAPAGWAICDGRSLKITDYEALYSLIGATYGGDGSTTFKVPNMTGMTAVGLGSGTGLTPRALGQTGGANTVALTTAQMPTHNHGFNATSAAATATVANYTMTFATVASDSAVYNDGANPATGATNLGVSTLGVVGVSQDHDNTMPSAVINFIIALSGTYPPVG